MSSQYVVFADGERIGSGDLAAVMPAAGRDTGALVFDRRTGRVIDLDPRQGPADEPVAARRGRPKLGVVAREVTLLPRHWDWLARQPGGASTTLRRLVDAARKADAGVTDRRERIEAAYRFMSVVAGDRPGFEEASRALFAEDQAQLAARLAIWPADIGDEIARLLQPLADEQF